jgi:polysaccharide transporter, PST family
MGCALLMRFVIGSIAAALVWLGLPLIADDDPIQKRLVAVVALGAYAPMLSVPALWFQARTESRVTVLATSVVFIMFVGLRLLIVKREGGVEAFAWTAIAEIVLSNGLIAAAWLRRGGSVGFENLRRECARVIRSSFPLLIGSIAVTVYMRSDIVMLRWLISAEAAGVYHAGTRLSEAFYGIPVLLATSAVATITTASSDRHAFAQLVDRYFRMSAAFGYLTIVPFIAIAPWLLRMLFGESFTAAGTIAQVHLMTVLFAFMGVARGQVLITLGFTQFTMTASCIGALLNIALNFLLIPSMGPVGAAAASVSAFAVSTCLIGFFYKPVREVSIMQLRALLNPLPGRDHSRSTGGAH